MRNILLFVAIWTQFGLLFDHALEQGDGFVGVASSQHVLAFVVVIFDLNAGVILLSAKTKEMTHGIRRAYVQKKYAVVANARWARSENVLGIDASRCTTVPFPPIIVTRVLDL